METYRRSGTLERLALRFGPSLHQGTDSAPGTAFNCHVGRAEPRLRTAILAGRPRDRRIPLLALLRNKTKSLVLLFPPPGTTGFHGQDQRAASTRGIPRLEGSATNANSSELASSAANRAARAGAGHAQSRRLLLASATFANSCRSGRRRGLLPKPGAGSCPGSATSRNRPRRPQASNQAAVVGPLTELCCAISGIHGSTPLMISASSCSMRAPQVQATPCSLPRTMNICQAKSPPFPFGLRWRPEGSDAKPAARAGPNRHTDSTWNLRAAPS